MPNFEVFNKVTTVGEAPALTLQRSGLISLNRGAHEAMGKPGAVELLFDKEEQLMGLRPTSLSCANAVRLREQSSGSGFVISARAFVQHFNISIEFAHRHRAELVDGILCAD